jgi:hypothetical protein
MADTKPGWDSISKWTQLYRDSTGSPLGSAALLALLGGTAGYFAGPKLASGYGRRLLRASGVPENEIEEEMEQLKRGPMRWRMAAGGAALLGGASLAHNYSSKEPWSGFKSWDRTPPTMPKQGMEKLAQFFGSGDLNPLAQHPAIPVGPAKELVFRDPNIPMGAKADIMGIFNKADSGQGLVSISQLGRAAMHAGFGYLTGKAVGSVLSSALGLPPKMGDKLSQVGGIANALMNVGVLGR